MPFEWNERPVQGLFSIFIRGIYSNMTAHVINDSILTSMTETTYSILDVQSQKSIQFINKQYIKRCC